MSKKIKTKILAVLAAVSIIAVGCAYALMQLGSGLDESRAADSYKEFKSDDIAHGWDGTCPWSIDKDGTLTLWEGTPNAHTDVQNTPNATTYYYSITASKYNALAADVKKLYVMCADGYYWRYADPTVGNDWGGKRNQVLNIVVKNEVVLKNCMALFSGCINARTVELPQDMSQCTNIAALFDGCISLYSVDMSNRDIASLTDMHYAFRSCNSLEWVWLDNVNTDNVKNMRYMFQGCSKLVNVDVSNFSTKRLEEISGMFSGCSSLASVDFSKYIIPNVPVASLHGYVFAGCDSIRRFNFGNNDLNMVDFSFAPKIPTTAPYTGKWVKEDDPSIVLSTSELITNYPNSKAPRGTYIWQVLSTTSVVEFDANGGNEVRDKIVQDSPTPIQLSQDSTYRDGYKFIGWNTERDGSGIAYEPNVSYTPELGQNIILYAQWQKLQEDLVIQVESNSDGFGSATVSWPDYNYVNRNFKVYQSADGGSTWNSVGVDYRDVKEVKCLQIYPVAAAKGQLKTWMETNGYGKGIIKIDEVLIDDFNAAPNSYLRDAAGNYKYDVIFFGTYDSNGSKDLTVSSLPYVEQFIKSGRGVIFGHDTMSAKRDYIKLLAPYIDIDNMVSASGEYWTDGSPLYSPTIYSGNPIRPFGAPTQGTSAITPEVASMVKITSQGLLTNYPHNIGSNGTVLTIPAAHSGQAAHGRIWMRFYLDSYTQEQMNNPLNFYLTTNNNCAMIQTGHSNGLATDDEQKILANLIFYMNQLLFNTSTLRDASAQDTTAPAIFSHEIKADNQHAITLTSEDYGNTYSYYVESYTKDDTTETGHLHTSQTEDVTVTTGVKEYRYLFDDSPDTKISVTDAMNLPSCTPDMSIIYPFGTKYAHIVAVDGAGNVSDTYTVRVPAPTRTTFEAHKLMKDGSSIADGEFSFYLQRALEDGRPWATAPILDKAACSADGVAYLMTPASTSYSVGITAPGIYYYTIREQAGTDQGMNYDTHYETVKVTAEDDQQGNLILSFEYDIADGDNTEGILFENTRLEAPIEIEKIAKGVTSGFTNREYEFTVDLKDATGAPIKDVPYHRYAQNAALGGKLDEIENGLISDGDKFYLRATEKMMIGTSHGTTYKITEAPLPGYTVEVLDDEGVADYTMHGAYPLFTNIYEAAGTSPTYIGHVFNTGSRVEAGQYTFELVDKDGNVIGTAANTADGTFSFDGINFTAEDDGKTFDYVMRQVIPDDAENGCYIYDEEQAKISVSVSDNGDGTLSFDVKATKGDSEYDIAAGEAIEFVNGFSIDMPETGLGGYWWIIGVGTGLLIIYIATAAQSGHPTRSSETRKR